MVEENGSEVAVELWRHASSAVSSVLSYPEGRAALAAARRTERLSTADHRRAIEDFDDLQRELIRVGVDEELARRAGLVAEQWALRGYDAVHLATALELGAEAPMITWDAQLRQAAQHAGLSTAPASA